MKKLLFIILIMFCLWSFGTYSGKPQHIRQIGATPYTVVITDDFVGDLTTHPSILHNPDKFEISEDAIPENVQYLNYQE